MSNGSKLAFVVIFILFGMSVFVAVSSLSERTLLEKSVAAKVLESSQVKEREKKLIEDNQRLEGQLKDQKNRESKLQEQLDGINNQITQLTVERDDWKNKVDSLRKERDDVMAKFQEKSSVPPQIIYKEVPTKGEAPSAPDQYWADTIKQKASLEIKVNNFQNQLSSKAIEADELKKKNSDLMLELGQLKNEKEEIDHKIKESEDLADSMAIELAKERNNRKYFDEKLDKFKGENSQLRTQIKELTSTKITLEKNISELKKSKDAVEKRLAEAENIVQGRLDDILNIKNSLEQRFPSVKQAAAQAAVSQAQGKSKEVELPPIVVSATASGNNDSAVPAGFNGKVVSINGDENFVVVDIGQDSGIHVGDRLSVYHDNQYISDLEIIQVRKNVSAADIKEKSADLRVGDTVR